MKFGIVGLPNVGKSSLFSALTRVQADIANYPFATIEPNVAVVPVPDERLPKLAELEKSEKIVPATIEFVDIAGLVAGAHKGEGLGNKFLSNIRDVDAILHLVRTFENPDITHVSGRISPEDDKKIILLELILADLEYIQKRIQSVEKQAKADKEAKEKLDVLSKFRQALENEELASSVNFTAEENELVKDVQLLTIKPIITVANSEKDGETAIGNEPALGINVRQEYDISQIPESERQEYIKELGLRE